MEKKLEGLLKKELIGMHVEVVGKNVQGKIIDETKNMLTIKTKKGIKKIIKKNNKMEFTIENERIAVEGDRLVARPEDRIKLKNR
ncbi:ribonuclease P protein subunit [Candidatus Woesearchaeota archaeon]|nr:ribonuclease P protein subunit [Candidatus Woesearchaeota archaeon]